ncbi:MAG TPA: hypothetical protein VFG72_14450 [Marmoricola sp.]|nr:hypothetical protein [Marmoricola sp.]
MTADERDLTPEEEDEVTRLLAGAGGPLRTPPDVVARLDDVLAGLVAERDADAAASIPAPSAAPASLEGRRRRRWPKALLAAAAVVAGGYGVTTALSGVTMSGSDSAGSADEAAGGAGAESSGSDAGGQAMGDRVRRDGADGQAGEAPANAAALRDQPPLLRADHLAEDVSRLLDDAAQQKRATDGPAQLLKGTLPPKAAACVPSRLGPDDTWYLVRYDGRRAALVAAPPDGGTVRASVLGCDGERLGSVAAPAP